MKKWLCSAVNLLIINILLALLIPFTSCGNLSENRFLSDSIDIKNKNNHIFQSKFIEDNSKSYIYLTFDDGPQNGTAGVADICRKLEIKASFFMVGSHASSNNLKQIVQNIQGSYPQLLVCNHSFTHANGHYKFFYNHPQMAADDFFKTQKSLGIQYKIIRLPGNRAWVEKEGIRASDLVRPVCTILDSAGYNVIGWDIEWHFKHRSSFPIQTPEQMLAMVDSALSGNNTRTNRHIVILCHDRMFRTPEYATSLVKFIQLLKQNPNYLFETVDHYPGLKPLN